MHHHHRAATSARATAPTEPQQLAHGARALATYLLDVVAHHSYANDPDDPRSVHLLAVGGPTGPAVLILDASVLAYAALLLQHPPHEDAA